MPKTLGIEQEFFVVSADTAACVRELPGDFFVAAQRKLGVGVTRELLGSMIELVTDKHTRAGDAVAELQARRRRLEQIARDHGLALMACGTHPFSDWLGQQLSTGERYDAVADNMAGLTRRAHVCGIHVHVGLDSMEARIDVLNRIQPILPLMAPITASSPIWRGEPMGVESYRMIAYAEGPRTGLPGRFSGPDEYAAVVRGWQEAGLVQDSSFCWWWIRPSFKHPTLELRIADSCADLDRIAFLAAFYRCSVAYLINQPCVFRAWPSHQDVILRENLWQAARAGFDAIQIDCETGRPELLIAQLGRWIERLLPLARAFGDGAALENGLSILERATEARAIRNAFDQARRVGHTPHEAARKAARAAMLAPKPRRAPGSALTPAQ
jgi:carboxylate-amine ligase